MDGRERVGLRHGMVYDLGPGVVAIGFVSNPAYDNQPLWVDLTVDPDGGVEHKVILHGGDQFAVGDQAWRLASVDNVGTYDYVVWIERVRAGGAATGGAGPDLSAK